MCLLRLRLKGSQEAKPSPKERKSARKWYNAEFADNRDVIVVVIATTIVPRNEEGVCGIGNDCPKWIGCILTHEVIEIGESEAIVGCRRIRITTAII